MSLKYSDTPANGLPTNCFNDHLVGAITEDTSSVGFVIFSLQTLEAIASHREKINPICPRDGWNEQDPEEVIKAIDTCIKKTLNQVFQSRQHTLDIVAIGIATQRETALCWNKSTGKPLYNCITSLDTRTNKMVDELRKRMIFSFLTGTSLNYSAGALKFRWMIENVSIISSSIAKEECLFGSIDSWIIYNLTGGAGKGIYVTDVTNASTTMLMNIDNCNWDKNLLNFFRIPISVLPTIKSSSEFYGRIRKGPLKDVPIAGCLREQQANFVGLQCLQKGMVQGTFNNEIRLFCNTGNDVIRSKNGLSATVAYKFDKEKPVYALEFVNTVVEQTVSWITENFHTVKDYNEVEQAAKEAEKTPEGDVVLVPAFDGLGFPYYRPDSRGTICGITFDTKVEHVMKAFLDAVCFQTADVLKEIVAETKFQPQKLLVDGDLTQSDILMQNKANIIGMKLEKPITNELTALGAALAAARGMGFWNFNSKNCRLPTKIWEPQISEEERNSKIEKWKLALEKSLWIDH